MKNTMKKGMSILLALLMFAALLVPVAAAGDNTLTINNAKGGHTYEAYQIFTGTYSKADGATKGNLSNAAWGEGVDDAALLTALKADDTIGTLFANCEDAQDVADVLQNEISDDSDELDAFAEVVNSCLSTTCTVSTPSGEAPNYVYTISNLDDGYYLVKDQDGSLADAEYDAYTKLIVKMVGSVNVNAKADTPTLNKAITELVCDNDAADHTHTDTCYDDVTANNAAIGDTISFKLTSAVPDMDGYKEYKFKIVDTLSKGLTYNNDIVVKIGNDTLTANTDYTVTTENDTDATVVTVTFNNFIQYKEQKDAAILVTYTAELNENAVVGETNSNKAKLVYSNNPQNDGSATPDDPDDGDVEETPENSVTDTYTTGLKLIKYAVEDNKDIALTGAEFKITGTALNKVRIKKTESGEISSEIEPAEDFSVTAEVDEDGYLQLEGLAAGTYVIEEIKAPDGYNLLKDKITVVITWNADTGFAATAKVGNGEASSLSSVNSVFEYKVLNQAGPVLPETGGIGTHILYIAGGILLTGAVVLLLVKVLTDRKKRAN